MKKIDLKLVIEIIISIIFLLSIVFLYNKFQKNEFDFETLEIIVMVIFIYSIVIYFFLSRFKSLKNILTSFISKGSKKELTEMEEIIMKYYLQKRELENAKFESEIQAKAKEVFLQNMSHEIRTPLNGIVNMTELLKYTPLNEKQQRYVDTIIKVSNTLIDTINNILDYSKIQTQKLALNIEPFSLNELIKDLKLFFISSTKEEVFVLFTISRNVPEIVIGDSFRIKQVLINLIGNAIKFTPKGYILLEIRVKERVEENVVIEFEIKDTGIGIPEEKKGELFKSFMQADESISRRYGGTGLGLAISKEIVEAMSGKIKVESKIKKGSSFITEVPFKIKKDSEEIDFDEENIIIFQDKPEITDYII